MPFFFLMKPHAASRSGRCHPAVNDVPALQHDEEFFLFDTENAVPGTT
jgi:hypothetical protein